MGSIRALILAGVFATGAAAPALAADLLPPPPVVAPPMVAEVDTSGWYLRGDVGIGVNGMSSLRSTFQSTDLVGAPYPPAGLVTAPGNNSIGDSAVIDVGVGYQINNWFRTDLTVGYHTMAPYTNTTLYGPLSQCGWQNSNPSPTYCFDNYSAQVSSIHGLVNGYVDLGTWYGVTPYVGAGLGLARVSMTGLLDTGAGSSVGYGSNISKTNFAWALMTGLSYNVNDRLKLEMGYRYLNEGTMTSAPLTCNVPVGCARETQSFKLTSQDVRVGMRWMLGSDPTSNTLIASNAPLFGGPAVASRPGSLVRSKY